MIQKGVGEDLIRAVCVHMEPEDVITVLLEILEEAKTLKGIKEDQREHNG